MTGFEQRVLFEPGYNYLHETGPTRRGQHGMDLRFLLIGELGATQFLMFTNWAPLGPVDTGSREPCHIDYTVSDPWGRGSFGVVRPPMAVDVGYHWWTPIYDGDYPMKCQLAPDGQCYYDGSGTTADHVLRAFIERGDAAVWEALREMYAKTAARVER